MCVFLLTNCDHPDVHTPYVSVKWYTHLAIHVFRLISSDFIFYSSIGPFNRVFFFFFLFHFCLVLLHYTQHIYSRCCYLVECRGSLRLWFSAFVLYSCVCCCWLFFASFIRNIPRPFCIILYHFSFLPLFHSFHSIVLYSWSVHINILRCVLTFSFMQNGNFLLYSRINSLAQHKSKFVFRWMWCLLLGLPLSFLSHSFFIH